MPSSDSGDDSENVSDSDMTDSSIESEAEENAATPAVPSSSEQAGTSRGEAAGQSNEAEEEEEEDHLVKAIKAELNKQRDHPPEINFDDLIVDISFHPSTNILAAASVTGDVFLYKYDNHANELLSTLELHVKACRDIEFSTNGDILYSCGKDKCIMLTDMETGKLRKFYENCHEHSLYRLYELDDNIICSGDENGTVKMWDIRQNDPILSFTECEEYISDMISKDGKKFLVCSSGDGTLTAFNIIAKKPYVQSEEYDAELNSMQLCKLDTKLVVGSSNGKMYFFNWGEFGYHSDEYFGVKGAINSVLAVTENMALAAYDDGLIRAYNFYPHRHIGIAGQHKSSIEALDISHDGDFVASCSLDQCVKFWNIRYFEDVHMNKGKYQKKKTIAHNLPSSNVRNPADFFAGLA
ncbi:UNVERIFIED_CONTAM: hypothetical protein PYX00_005826 [Menopon gallinae]